MYYHKRINKKILASQVCRFVLIFLTTLSNGLTAKCKVRSMGDLHLTFCINLLHPMHTHIHTINAHPLTATTKSGNNNVHCLNALPEYVTLQTIVNVYCCSKKGGLTNCYKGNRLSSVLGSMLV